MKALQGYKTYISAAFLMINGVLYGFGLYTIEVFLAVSAVLTGGSLAALRAGVKRDTDK